MIGNFKRRLFSLLFFTFFFSLSQANTGPQEELKVLASSEQWQNLLHLQEGIPIIKDPNFIITLAHFSPLNELKATLKLFSRNSQASCKFLARYHFLSSKLNSQWKVKTPNCTQYNNFKQQAPADEISLIYTSENLTQPSSMMGHTMLAISGRDKNQRLIEHAVSYFTNLDSYNIASILWDTLYKGKEGYFIVGPLQPAMDQYLKKEQRNVWRYTLKLSSYQRELIHKHIWELKNVDIPYFFHKQNCATLSQRIIGIAEPELFPKKDSWISPIDVIKSSESAQLISDTKIYPSNQWKIHLLSDFIETQNNETEERIGVSKYLQKELNKTYSDFQYENGHISRNQWASQLKPLKDSNDIKLNLYGYKSPTKTPHDSQLQYAFEYTNQKDWLSIGWMPASHSLEDDNRQYFSENELRLSNVALMVSTQADAIRLKHWHIYSIKQYIPRNHLTGGLSGSFGFGFDQHYDPQLDPYLGSYTKAGLGLTHKISADLNIYYTLNVGAVLGQENSALYIEPELGAYLYEIFNMKTWLSYKHRKTLDNNQNIWSLKHSFLHNKSLSAIFDIKHRKTDNSEQLSASLEFRYYY